MQPRKWASIPLKSPGIKPRRQNNSNTSGNSSGLPFPFANKQQHAQPLQQIQHAAAAAASCSHSDTISLAEHSPSSSSSHNHTNPQAFSVFANVNIPERNGGIWSANNAQQQTQATTSNVAINNKIDEHFEGNGEFNFMPNKKLIDSAAISPTSIAAAMSLGPSDETSMASGVCLMDAAIESTAEAASQSPLLKLLSPRHHDNKHSSKNRSPFQNTLPSNKFQTASNFRYLTIQAFF